ncbi:MAG: DUF1611 domain-containing protein [Roseovarius sp.]|nr:DUF1611 domain-containing protein [Roseovarius sp.]
MLEPDRRIAIYAEATLGLINAKMAEGIIRYGRNPVVCVIDSHAAGRPLSELCKIDRDIPIVATLDEALAMGAEVLVLGTTPSGGRVPPEWMAMLEQAVGAGLCVVNGLHDRLNDVLGARLAPGQWIWDIRTPVDAMPPIAMARAAALANIRVVMVGTDMAVGKKTAGLEICRALVASGRDAVFLATGQSGIAITGAGIPLDAFRVDHAAGAVERLVLEHAAREVLIIEGQGSLLHPGSTATLPLMRGSCANALILCHRARMTRLDTSTDIRIPPLREVIALNEAVAVAAGALTRARVVGVALNTRDLAEAEAQGEIAAVAAETGLPVADPVRFGAGPLAEAVAAAGG